MAVHWFADYIKSIIMTFFYVRLQAVSFCSSESVEETQKSSGEAASELARDYQKEIHLTISIASPLDSRLVLRSRKKLLETARSLFLCM